jgi:hypothetical protein
MNYFRFGGNFAQHTKRMTQRWELLALQQKCAAPANLLFITFKYFAMLAATVGA